MKKECRRACAREGGSNLLADNAGLADAGDDHAPAARHQQFYRMLKCAIEAIDEPLNRRRFRLQHLPGECHIDLHARTPFATVVSRVTASIRFSFRSSASSLSRRSAFAASLLARAGSSWTSMNTASTPAATPAEASGSIYSASPAVTPSPAPGSWRLCVTSKTTG